MFVPPVHARGARLYADLRGAGGQRHTSLGLAAGADPVAVGMAIQRRLDELRAAGAVAAPGLPGIERAALSFAALLDQYQDARQDDHATAGGRAYVGQRCKRLRRDLGHLDVSQLAGHVGAAALREYRSRLWKEGLGGRSVRNLVGMALAVLTWGRSDGRDLTGELPQRPKRWTPAGEPLATICSTTMAEADFRHFRAHIFDAAVKTGIMQREHPDDWQDVIARRQLWLSLAFYTGAHPEDLATFRGAYLSADVRRYERHNTKSARAVEPQWFDMPEALAIDVEAELRRRGLPRFPERELICGRPWSSRRNRTFAAACARIWPDGSRQFTARVARRSTVWEYTLRGWRTHEIAAILGHVDEAMVREIYRRVTAVGMISPVRVPWSVGSGPGGRPTELGKVLAFDAAK